MFVYDDNFLTLEDIKEIEDVFWNINIGWHFHKNTQNDELLHPGVVNTGIKDESYFSTNFNNQSKEFTSVKKIIDKFCIKNNIKYKHIYRTKFNIQPYVKNAKPLYPHVDMTDPHLIFLYYVCDSDGDTVIYNETFNGTIIKTPLSIMKSISPKRGTAIVVDGKYFHSITPPSNNSLRAVINVNLIQ